MELGRGEGFKVGKKLRFQRKYWDPRDGPAVRFDDCLLPTHILKREGSSSAR